MLDNLLSSDRPVPSRVLTHLLVDGRELTCLLVAGRVLCFGVNTPKVDNKVLNHIPVCTHLSVDSTMLTHLSVDNRVLKKC